MIDSVFDAGLTLQNGICSKIHIMDCTSVIVETYYVHGWSELTTLVIEGFPQTQKIDCANFSNYL